MIKAPNGNRLSIPPRPRGPGEDGAPPADVSAEAAALGCIIQAGSEGSTAEVDEMMRKLRLSLFYDLRHKALFRTVWQLRADGHAVDPVTIHAAARAAGTVEEIGGMAYVDELPDRCPSWLNFGAYVDSLGEQAHRRWLLSKSAELAALATEPRISVEETRERLADLFDQTNKAAGEPLIELVTPAEARAFTPDPEDFLVGDGLVSRDQFITIGGEPGCGKSRLATTLAVALAEGGGSWQGYPVRTRCRTLILQTENKGQRLRDEFLSINPSADDWIKVSTGLRNGLAFSSPDFRRELGRIYDRWSFGLLIVDPWNDVVAEEGASDYAESLLNIQRCFQGRKCPAVLIVAHLRKPRADASGRRKTGRELLHELSGSLKLGSTSRTVFAVQPASPEMDDDRIVFEIAKANDCAPEWLRQHGTRSAWHRRNGAFAPAAGFDWEAWANPGPPNAEKRAVTEEMIADVFKATGRRGMKTAELVREIVARFGVGSSTAWRALGKGGYAAEWLDEAAGVVSLP